VKILLPPWLGILLTLAPLLAFAQENIPDPCGGPSALLSISNRGGNADSPCLVPFKEFVFESGYQYETIAPGSGRLQYYPTSALRFGLPANSEFAVLLPTYNQLSDPHITGFGATTLAIKHKLGYNQKWLATAEALFTLPSGSLAYGSNNLGVVVNGIVNYTINDKFSWIAMLGVSRQSLPKLFGGQNYSSVNPDLVLSYSPTDTINLYGEIYAQTKTAPTQGRGVNVDCGILYLVKSNLVLELEFQQRVSGYLGGFNQLITTGFSLAFT